MKKWLKHLNSTPFGASPSGAASLPLECPAGSQTGLPRLKPKACS